jgi:hypothetical protein
MTTWNEIARAAETAPFNSGLFHFTMSAETNAQDTIDEGNGTQDDFDRLALSTLQQILSYSDDKAAHKFFADLGVVW